MREAGKITADFLNHIYEYKDGKLFWKIKFTDKTVVGQEVGHIKNGRAYTKINKKDYSLHRLIFLMHHNYLPETIDHIDGDPLNNCIENLRECSISQNMYNSKLPVTNTSGYKNVTWKKDREKWKVEVRSNNKPYFFGYFNNVDDANEAAIVARNLLHKEFAKHE